MPTSTSRQSTLYQVANNTESTRRQYDLRGRAVALGWPAERVVVIDDRPGPVRASSAPTGPGSSAWSPTSPSAGQGSCSGWNVRGWHATTPTGTGCSKLCSLNSTLICDEDGLYDPTTFNDRALLGLKGQMSEFELHFLRARLQGGILAKARRGELTCSCRSGWSTTRRPGEPRPRRGRPRRPRCCSTPSPRPARPPPRSRRSATDGLSFPGRHLHAAPHAGELYWNRCATTWSCSRPAQPRLCRRLLSTAGPPHHRPRRRPRTVFKPRRRVDRPDPRRPSRLPDLAAVPGQPGPARRQRRRPTATTATPARPAKDPPLLQGPDRLRQVRPPHDRALPLPHRRHPDPRLRLPDTTASRTRTADLPAHGRRRHRRRRRRPLLATLTPLAIEAALDRQLRADPAAQHADRSAPPTSSAPSTPPTTPAAATSPSTPATGSSPTPSKPTGTPGCAT